MSLPVPSQDEHLPDQIEAFVHQAGLQIQRRLSEPSSRRPTRSWSCRTAAAKPAPVSSAGDAAVHLQDDLRRGHRPAVADQPQARRHHRVPSARAWETSHQLHITRNLRNAVCDQLSNKSAGESRAEVFRNAGDEVLLGLSTIIDIVHRRASNWSAPT